MLLTTGRPATTADVVIEPKFDGVRSIVTIHDDIVTIRSRNGHDVTDCYPEIADFPAAVRGRSAVFDGEIIATNDRGLGDFQRLQRRMNRRRPPPAVLADTPVWLVLFDLLWLDGEDTTSRPFHERRRLLEALVAVPGRWQLVQRLPGPIANELLNACASAGMEGVVVKTNVAYRPGRRAKHWVKIKFRHTQLAVIGAVTRHSAGSLAVGAHHNGQLHYIGQVGVSLPHHDSAHLEAFLQTIPTAVSPFVDLAPADAAWVEPLIVVEVSHIEITNAGTLRQPVLTAVRPDIAADTVLLGDALATKIHGRGTITIATGQRL